MSERYLGETTVNAYNAELWGEWGNAVIGTGESGRGTIALARRALSQLADTLLRSEWTQARQRLREFQSYLNQAKYIAAQHRLPALRPLIDLGTYVGPDPLNIGRVVGWGAAGIGALWLLKKLARR